MVAQRQWAPQSHQPLPVAHNLLLQRGELAAWVHALEEHLPKAQLCPVVLRGRLAVHHEKLLRLAMGWRRCPCRGSGGRGGSDDHCQQPAPRAPAAAMGRRHVRTHRGRRCPPRAARC